VRCQEGVAKEDRREASPLTPHMRNTRLTYSSTALVSHVKTLERRVTELEASLLQMRSDIRASTSTPTANLTSPRSALGNHSEDTSVCISPCIQQKTAVSAPAEPYPLWTCLGQHWYFKGVPVNSTKGREWMSSKVGENVSLDGFRLFGTQKRDLSSPPPSFSFPERHTVEEFLNSYFNSHWRLIYPIIDPGLVEDTLAEAYAESRGARVCLLAFMAMSSRLKGSQLQLNESDVYVHASHSYLPQLLSQGTLESLQTVLMLVSQPLQVFVILF
jgi:hypothetical protein